MFTNYLKCLDLIYVSDITEKLLTNQLTSKQFHNKKHYAKSTGKVNQVLELTLAWELYKVKVDG